MSDRVPFELPMAEPGLAADKFAPLMSSANPNWETPDSFLDVVRQMGPIGLDPCTTPQNPVGAMAFFHPLPTDCAICAEIPPIGDGLTLSWISPVGHNNGATGGLVFCNPPYGRGLGAWSAKMRDEGKRGAEIIGLVPARTDTKWWAAITTADAVCFWRGRLKFKGAPHAAPFPNAVPYWGPRAAEFRRIFERHGWVVFSKQQSLFPVG